MTAIQRWRNTDGATLTTSMQYDATGNVLSVTDPLNHVTTTSYAGVWGDTTCLPPGGGASAAFPTQVTDPAGLITKHSYNSCTNTLATSTDSNNQVTSFTYDLMDRVIQTTLPDAGQTSTCFSEVSSGSCYSSSFPLKVVATQKITSAVSKTSTTILDGLARITQTQTSDPDCSSGSADKVDITYDSNERKSTVTNPYCTTSDTTYGLTTYNYDALDRVTKVIPPDGTSTANNVTTSYDSLPVVGNSIINCTLVTDQAGNQRRSCSDALGRLIEVDEPGSLTPGTPGTGSTSVSGATQTYTFDPCQGNQPPAPTSCPQTVFDTTTIYVTIGTWSTSISAGNSGDTPAIVASRLAAALNASGSPVSAVASGSTVTVTARWAGASTNYTIGTSTTYNTQFFSGPAFTATSGTMTGGTDGNPGTGPPSINSPLVTLYAYDLLNNLTRVDQKGNQPSDSTKWRTRSFTYNSLSQLVCAANPEIAPVGNNCPTSSTGTFPAGAVTYAYDNDGNLTTKTSPKPNQASSSVTVATTYSYDLDNRVTQKSYNDSFTATVKYGYDGVALAGCTTAPPTLTDTYPKGRRTSMCDKSGATSWSHDKMGRTASEKRTIVGTANVTKSTPSTYNLDGSVATLTNPGTGTVITYTYNAAGRATSDKDNGSGNNYAYNATYAPFGGLAALSMGSKPITVSNQYNKRLQPGVLSASTVTATIMSFSYDFHLGTGDNGNVFTIRNDRDNNRTQNFTYDGLNRIATSYTNGSNWGEDFTIDAWGNLSNRTVHPGKTNYEQLSAAATNQNRLTGFGYDAAGNMTSNGGASYTYDAENHLVLTSGYAYFYDGDGNRMKKCTSTAAFTCQTSPTGTLYWRGAGSDPLIETTLGGTNQEEYIFFNGKRIARRDVSNSAVHYYFSDHLGSTSMTTDANGTMSACPTNSTLITGEDESDYYPYGGEQPLCNRVAQNYKFTGKERDGESGLDDFVARFDASNLGRFMTPDWSADPATVPYARFESPQSLNLYAYAQNNPATLSDPSGHQETLGTQAMERDNEDFLAGKITEQQWKERQQARAAGVAIGLGMLGAVYTGSEAYASALLRNLIGLAAITAPQWQPIVLDTIEGMTPGAPGTLTIARNTRLTEQEISAGGRFARQAGIGLIESTHKAEEFLDAAGRTYDVMQPGPARFWTFWNQRNFVLRLIDHLQHDDVVIIDLKGASKVQVDSIKAWVSKFNSQCAQKIRFLNE